MAINHLILQNFEDVLNNTSICLMLVIDYCNAKVCVLLRCIITCFHDMYSRYEYVIFLQADSKMKPLHSLFALDYRWSVCRHIAPQDRLFEVMCLDYLMRSNFHLLASCLLVAFKETNL
jgi:hypothetical protein